MITLTMGSLFAGVGGFDIAAERAGIEVLWQSENDSDASDVLRHRMPDIPNLGDIHEIGDHNDTPPQVDILAGGFPCQSYSIAGDRGGLAEDRGALWWEFHRLIGEGQPTWVLGENVQGLLSSAGSRDFTTIIKSLVQLGYGVVWRLLDAECVGLPQRRKRVFIVGHHGDRPRPEALALSESMSRDDRPRSKTWDDATRAAEHDPDGAGKPILMRQREGKPGGGKGPLLSYDRSLTLAANTNDQTVFVNGTARRLTPVECERLQGFDDGWTDVEGSNDGKRYKQMGNAVAVPVVEWIMKRIVAAENGEI